MRVLALIINAYALLLCVWLIVSKGAPHNGADVVIITTFILSPVISSIALFVRYGFSMPELLRLEIEARKAKLRKQIAESNPTAAP